MNQWLKWITSLQAIAQNGLTFARDPFDQERYQNIQTLAAEMLAHISTVPAEHIDVVWSIQKGYATPKIGVRAAVIQEGKILLVKERSDQRWSLPGGWADVNASPREVVEKEVREESGYIVKATKLVALHDDQKHPHPQHLHHAYIAFFLCTLEGGHPQPNIEISEIDFFDPAALPPLSLGRVLPEQIAMLFKHHADPNLPTEFD